ncbi:YbhB/YbcL family Raf kinase inhibitor-like protein [Kocuria sp.]|uniref:YbhB/YbcL family Raf kinase inhibitor-like protein n=1 Tax=Kocuria sp. TaxID=1871328 RepID=UPI0026DDAE5A|nr:YbhB/YbcL family Raf kinase inhibitor-like protein [Kocuria sp.]MDO4919166.1 YbhB/YbcL family Raf kinase inhibitor-like protein [Kocuria sp.]
MYDRHPYADLPELPTFTLTSTDVAEGETMKTPQLSGIMGAGGEDVSPQLSWSGAPEGTRSYVVTMFDPDAPTPSGFWHWCLSNVPADVTELATGAASNLPQAAVKHRNDAGTDEFLGAAPPEGHGPHRYIICVTAVDVPELEVDADTTPAVVNFTMSSHALGRAFLTPVYEAK